MSLGKRLAAWLLTVGAAAFPAGAANAQNAEPYDIPVIIPLTGGGSFLGQSNQATLQAEESLINQQGGIGGRPVHFVFHDDQTSPQVAVQTVNRIGRVPVFLGSSLSAMCNAIAPLLRNGPFDYCLSPGVHPAPGTFQFSSLVALNDIAPVVFHYFKARGWTKIALMFSTDASGQDAEQAFEAAVKEAGVDIVTRAHFAPGDLNVSAQMEQIKSASPQAVIAWASGAPTGTILKGYAQAGLGFPLMIGQANLSHQFMSQYGDVLPRELYLPAGTGSVSGLVAKLDPRVQAAREVYARTLGAAKLQPENAVEVVWDPAMIVVDALRHVGPGASASQIRSYIDGLTDYAGVSGIYDFKTFPQRGLSGKEVVISRWNGDAKQFEAVSAVGGDPLK